MDKNFRVELFGKINCEKCDALKKRIQILLKKNNSYKTNFSYIYYDLSTVEGLCAFAKAETVNSQRIPTIQITKFNKESGEYQKIPDNRPEEYKEGKLFVPVYFQLETDYSDQKRSVIRPNEIEELFCMALNN